MESVRERPFSSLVYESAMARSSSRPHVQALGAAAGAGVEHIIREVFDRDKDVLRLAAWAEHRLALLVGDDVDSPEHLVAHLRAAARPHPLLELGFDVHLGHLFTVDLNDIVDFHKKRVALVPDLVVFAH